MKVKNFTQFVNESRDWDRVMGGEKAAKQLIKQYRGAKNIDTHDADSFLFDFANDHSLEGSPDNSWVDDFVDELEKQGAKDIVRANLYS